MYVFVPTVILVGIRSHTARNGVPRIDVPYRHLKWNPIMNDAHGPGYYLSHLQLCYYDLHGMYYLSKELTHLDLQRTEHRCLTTTISDSPLRSHSRSLLVILSFTVVAIHERENGSEIRVSQEYGVGHGKSIYLLRCSRGPKIHAYVGL